MTLISNPFSLLGGPCILFTVTAIPVLAQSVSTTNLEPSCKATIFDMEREMENYKSAYVRGVHMYDISTEANLPTKKTRHLSVSLDAYDTQATGDIVAHSSALDLLESSQMLRDFSQNIIDRCDNIVAITFHVTEYQSRRFGWIDGAVREFRCPGEQTALELPGGERLSGEERLCF
jgi:hypothetical protein